MNMVLWSTGMVFGAWDHECRHGSSVPGSWAGARVNKSKPGAWVHGVDLSPGSIGQAGKLGSRVQPGTGTD